MFFLHFNSHKSEVDLFFYKILDSRWVRNFKAKPVPRWLVLIVDMCIVTFSFGLCFFFDKFSTLGHGGWPMFCDWSLVLGVYFVISYFTKSYTHIIRLSVLEDLYREIVVVTIATLLLFGINKSASLWWNCLLLEYWHIVFIGAVSFSLLVFERLSIKYLYLHLTRVEVKRKHVLVLGTSLNSLLLANALQNEIGGDYAPIGLLSLGEHSDKKVINGFNVLDLDQESLGNFFVEHGVYALVFNSEYIDFVREHLADYFLEHNMHLLLFDKLREYELGDDNSNISSYVKEVQIEDLLGRDPIKLNSTLVRSHINGSCVLITGACGSIGSEIVRQVASYKAGRIVLVDQAETPMHDLFLEIHETYPNVDVVYFLGDVQNYARMEQAFIDYQPKFVFHAAAYKHVPMMEHNPTEAVLTNVMGTKNIADLALKHKVFKFVMVSTDKAVNPSNIMGCSKRLAEVYIQSLYFDARNRGLNTQMITTRFGNVLGSNGSVIPLFRKQIASGGPVTVTHHDIIRYFMTIPEACALVLEAGCMGKGGEIYIFDMGKPIRIYDLATRMIALAGLRPGVDIEIKEVGLRPGEKLYEELLNDEELTSKTENEKIMIAKVRTYDFKEVCGRIDEIVNLASCGNRLGMVKAMKRFIPEFKSMHSEFEKIDQELLAEASVAKTVNNPETEIYY